MRKIINTHDQLVEAGGGVAITTSYTQGHTKSFYGWAVYRIDKGGKKIATCPDAPWYDHGMTVFAAFRKRMKVLAEVKAWIAEQGWYDGPWARNRMRDYVPAAINKQFPIRRD